MPEYNKKQLAAFEEAIEKKYGEDAVLDPSLLWSTEKEKEYLKQVKDVEKFYRQQPFENYIDQGGFILKEKLINKKSFKNCSLCKEQAYKTIDEVYMNKYDSCYICFVLKIENREEKWKQNKKFVESTR